MSVIAIAITKELTSSHLQEAISNVRLLTNKEIKDKKCFSFMMKVLLMEINANLVFINQPRTTKKKELQLCPLCAIEQ